MKRFEVLVTAEGGHSSVSSVSADKWHMDGDGYLYFHVSGEPEPVALFAPGWLNVLRK